MKCGHNADWVVRLVDRGERYTFCLGCLFEKVGMKDINGKEIKKIIPVGEKNEKSNKKVVEKTEVRSEKRQEE